MSTPLAHPVRETPPEDRVSFWKRVSYGCGGLSFHLGTDPLIHLANPIFNVALCLDPWLIGLVMGISRMWDGLTDPIMGAVSDNTRSRFGRRIPYMLAGTVGSGVAFALLWAIPHGLSTWTLFVWFLTFTLVFFTCQTVANVPWSALGFELTPDYHERTRVMEMRAYVGAAAKFIVPWAYAITQLPWWHGDVLLGTRYMGMIFGVLILITGLIPALSLKERFFKKAKKQAKLGLLKAVTLTLRNRPFILMVLITLFTVVGSSTVGVFGFYIGLYYLFQGDTAQQAILTGVGGNLDLVLHLVAVFVLRRVSQRMGKRKTLAICLVLLALSSVVKWLCITPAYPYLSLMVLFFTAPASAGFWLLIASIKADICDEDELKTGLRREGAYGAISMWISKVAYSLTAILSGVILALTGYQAALGGDQDPVTIDRMRFYYYLIPSATAIPALILLYFFPISEQRAMETRLLLEQRRGKL